jgi:hypothetical protein
MTQIPAREAAFRAIATELQARLPETVERNRDAPADPVECPLLVLSDGDHEVVEGDGAGLQTYTVRFRLAGYLGEAPAPFEVAELAHDLHARAVRGLICGAGATPRGLLVGDTEIWPIETGAQFDRATIAQSESPFATFVADFQFEIRTADGNPFVEV